MTGDLRAVLAQLGPLAPFATVLVLAALVAAVVVRVVPRLRERGYDRAAARERVRLVVALPARDDPDASVPVELIRALHPRQRRGVDAWRVGWPAYELRVAWRAGELAWEIETDGHGAAIATAALRALYPGVSIERSSGRDPTPTAVATGRLTGPLGWPVREVDAPEARPVRALAAALEHAPRGTEVRLRCLARPVPPERWRRDGATAADDASPSVIGFLVATIADAILLHPVADPAPKRQPARLTAAERDADARRRKGVVGFDVALSLEVAGIAGPAAEALLWRLIGFTAALDDGTQAIRWQIRRGAASPGPATRFADWELAQLWSLPDAAFDRAGFARARHHRVLPTTGQLSVRARCHQERLSTCGFANADGAKSFFRVADCARRSLDLLRCRRRVRARDPAGRLDRDPRPQSPWSGQSQGRLVSEGRWCRPRDQQLVQVSTRLDPPRE